MKFTKTQKVEIIEKMAKKVLTPEHDELKANLDAFCNKAYEIRWGEFHSNLRKTMKDSDFNKAFKIGITEYIVAQTPGHTSFNLVLDVPRISIMSNHKEVAIVLQRHIAKINQQSAPRTADISRGELVLIKDSDSDYKEALKIKAAHDAFKNKAEKVIDNITAIVMPVNTSERLLELLPEAADFIQIPTAKTTNIVPLSTVNAVREMLKTA